MNFSIDWRFLVAALVAVFVFIALRRGGGSTVSGRLELALGRIVGKARRHTMRVAPVEVVDVEEFDLSIAPKDADNRPVTAGPFTWSVVSSVPDSSDNPDEPVVRLTPDAGGLKCTVGSGQPGVALVTVTDGNLTDEIEIRIKAGAPAQLNLSAGAPRPE